MSDCPTCFPVDCTGIDDQNLYSLDTVVFPYILQCPPNQYCGPGGGNGSSVTVICCDVAHVLNFTTETLEQREAAITAQVTECARSMLSCGELGGDPDPFNPNNPTVNLFWNRQISCKVNCLDPVTGAVTQTFTYQFNAGQVLAFSQATADTYAYAQACALARDHKLCLGSLSDSLICANTAGTITIRATSKYVAGSGNTWAVTSGSLPTGMALTGTGPIVTLGGTPTTPGNFTFTLKVTLPNGDHQSRSYTVTVVGLTNSNPLPSPTIGVPYIENLVIGPAHDQETELWSIVSGTLPDGLELSDAGVINGTPTETGTFDFTVQFSAIFNGERLQCTQELAFENEIPVPIAYWKMEENNVSRIDSIGALELRQEFGVLIPSTAGKIANAALLTNGAFPYSDLSTNPYELAALRNQGLGFTVAGWANLTDSLQVIISYGFVDGASAPMGSLFIRADGVGNKIVLHGTDNLSVSFTVTQSDTAPTPGNWFFYRAWFDPADNKIRLQINNGAITSSAAVNYPASVKGTLDIYPDFTFNAGLQMKVDEMGIWMPHLTDDEATSLWNGGNGISYPF